MSNRRFVAVIVLLVAACTSLVSFAQMPLLPKGTTLVITAWHDNTMENPNNPDPEQWVGWGDRTVDEMAHAWVDVTYLEQEDYEMLVAERASGK